jgi:ATP/maltotriose-dependent transcriptional regulator MalT
VERAVQAADRDHPLFPAAVGTVARGYQVLGEFARARAIISLAEGREPGAGASFMAYPRDVLADVTMNDGDVSTATAYFEDLFTEAPNVTDPLRRVLMAERISLGHQAMQTHDGALPAAREAVRIADGTGNPTAQSLARCALGRALSVSQPDEALKTISEARELATSVENTWLITMAEMESATIHASRGDRVTAARGFSATLDMFVIAGPSTIIPLQWDNLRRVTQFLFRMGAVPEAAALHHAAVAAGRESPLDAAQVAELEGVDSVVLTGTEIVDYTRTALSRFC